jgi:UDP-N-acetylmuramate dehydrogenase
VSAIDDVAARLGPAVRREVPLGPLTTYRVGGAARLAVTPTGEDELVDVARAVAGTGVPVLVVGRGSNLLVADAGFDGLAVIVGEAFDSIEIDRDGARVTAGAAASLPVVARRAVAASVRGLEWAVGVPGSVGGAVRMNAGGHGSDIAASLIRARIVDLSTGRAEWRPAGALGLGYRRSLIGWSDVVVAAELAGTRGDRAASEAMIAEIVAWRRANQPGGQNAGSVFTNPPDDSAGRLVEAAGLKGYRHGSAQVSPKHANFIQADDGGSADDVRALIAEVRSCVKRRLGVDLRTEIRLIGFDGTYPSDMVGGRHG